jgi:hypothetical protein
MGSVPLFSITVKLLAHIPNDAAWVKCLLSDALYFMCVRIDNNAFLTVHKSFILVQIPR